MTDTPRNIKPQVDYDYPFETGQIEQTVRDPRPLQIRGKTYDFTKIELPTDHDAFPYHRATEERAKRQSA